MEKVWTFEEITSYNFEYIQEISLLFIYFFNINFTVEIDYKPLIWLFLYPIKNYHLRYRKFFIERFEFYFNVIPIKKNKIKKK